MKEKHPCHTKLKRTKESSKFQFNCDIYVYIVYIHDYHSCSPIDSKPMCHPYSTCSINSQLYNVTRQYSRQIYLHPIAFFSSTPPKEEQEHGNDWTYFVQITLKPPSSLPTKPSLKAQRQGAQSLDSEGRWGGYLRRGVYRQPLVLWG